MSGEIKMHKRNLKHDELFFSEDPKVIELGNKLYNAWNYQNGTEFLDAYLEIQELYGDKEYTPQLRASAVAYALYLVHETSRQR